ncbi:hypothetical protein MKW92_012244 [Papaver armeniacum]|nr:hypothetical protein MKW92_012244 [Papaver armeniacum]
MDANLIRFRQLSGFVIKEKPHLTKTHKFFSLNFEQTTKNDCLNPLRRNFSALGSSVKNGFNEAAFETERLSLDSKAREEMAEKAQIEISSSNAAEEEDPKAWKWIIRKRVWDMMEAENIAQNPRPVHHRIPNFVGAAAAAKKGFAELEYAMLRYMGAIDDNTPVVTSIHDRQLVDDIPVEKLLIHDVPVDIICTPTQVIFTNNSIPKPQGIYWDKLSPEKLGQIRVLRELKRRIERETGQRLASGPSEKLPATAQRKRR